MMPAFTGSICLTILPISLIQSIMFFCSLQSLGSNQSKWPFVAIYVPEVFDGLVCNLFLERTTLTILEKGKAKEQNTCVDLQARYKSKCNSCLNRGNIYYFYEHYKNPPKTNSEIIFCDPLIKLFLGPRGPLGTPSFVRSFVRPSACPRQKSKSHLKP